MKIKDYQSRFLENSKILIGEAKSATSKFFLNNNKSYHRKEFWGEECYSHVSCYRYGKKGRNCLLYLDDMDVNSILRNHNLMYETAGFVHDNTDHGYMSRMIGTIAPYDTFIMVAYPFADGFEFAHYIYESVEAKEQALAKGFFCYYDAVLEGITEQIVSKI